MYIVHVYIPKERNIVLEILLLKRKMLPKETM